MGRLLSRPYLVMGWRWTIGVKLCNSPICSTSVHVELVLNIGLFHFSLRFHPCFLAFLHHYCNAFLIENAFLYLANN